MAAEHRGSGKAKWYQVTEDIAVCGAYEVSFCVWLLDNGLEFTAHPEPLTWYDDDGTKHLYHPDFYVHRLGWYIDVKARHWAEVQATKLSKIRAQHPDVMIFTEDDFEYLKIPLLTPRRDDGSEIIEETPKREPYQGRFGISVGCKPPSKRKGGKRL